MIKSQNFDHYKFGVHFQWKYVTCNLQFVRQGSQKYLLKWQLAWALRGPQRHAKLLKGNRFYSLWMLVYKRTGDISPVSHMNKHKCIMNVHYLAIATVITFQEHAEKTVSHSRSRLRSESIRYSPLKSRIQQQQKKVNQFKWQMWYLECKLCINISSLVFNIGWLRGEHNVVYGESQSSQSCVDRTALEQGQGLWLLTVVIKASAKSKIKHAS